MSARKTKPPPDGRKIIAKNKKARYDFFIEETIEAGVSLLGSEVKSARDGRVSLTDAYAVIEKGEVFLVSAHIAELPQANQFNHEPRRKRKLLLHRREIERLIAKVREKGFTLAVLSMYFKRGKIKVEVGLARGKRAYDKRESIRRKDEKRFQDQSAKY
ncbi:MAG: SsrA-binding protein SmpB [bacterium]